METSVAGTGGRAEEGQTSAASLLGGFCLSVIAADLLLWNTEGGLGMGLYALVVFGLLFLRRRQVVPSRAEWSLVGLLLLSALQTGRYLSLSNFLTLVALLLFFAGLEPYAALRSRALRGVEMALAYCRPLVTVPALLRVRPPRSMRRWWDGLLIAVPAFVSLLLFTLLLSAGNTVLGAWTEDLGQAIENLLLHIDLTADECLFVLFIGALSLPLLAPPVLSGISRRIVREWPTVGGGRLVLRQWQWGLAALNVLFALSNVIDVLYLWIGRTLPEGVGHAEYVHEGVYALTATTVLSAAFMALLTQHGAQVRDNRVVRWLCRLWIAQNMVLISGVFLRLWLYIDTMGYTPKRVHVAFFLLLVLGGYIALGMALERAKDLKWLLARNCLMLFWFFAILQFVDVRSFVASRNLDLYRAGEIPAPDSEFLYDLGSPAIPLVIGVAESPRTTVEDAERMNRWLYPLETENGLLPAHIARLEPHSDWRSYQYRAAKNWELYQDYRQTHEAPERLP